MLAFVRGFFAAALVVLLSFSAIAADKPYKRDGLADAGDQARSADQGRRRPGDQDRRPRCAGKPTPPSSATTSAPACRCSGQIVVVAPDDSANWLRLAQVRAADPSEQRATNAPIARTRRDRGLHRLSAQQRQCRRGGREPGRASRAAIPTARCGGRRSMRCGISLDLREVADVRQQYERMRDEHGFRLARLYGGLRMPPRRGPASSSPKPCRAGASTFRRSSRSPARTGRRYSAEDQQLLRRGPQARRALRHHAARRPAVGGAARRWRSLPSSRSMFATASRSVRFTGKSYVLPRAGQHGIPVVSVNTSRRSRSRSTASAIAT